MGMTGPQPKKRALWMTGGITILSFVGLLYVVEAVNQATGDRLDYRGGIRPLQTDGLWGILFAPLLHADWQHLISNTVPALVLGFLMTLLGMSRFIFASVFIWIAGGFGTWLIGRVGNTCGGEPNIIGASGLILGWLTFLLVFGFFTRTLWQIAVGILVLLYYGTVLFGALPQVGCTGISWQGHLCGAVAGVFAAYVLSGPERKARERRKAGQLPGLTS
ncbi:rhomboid family intramembrane serine protease [Mycolicibacterium sarraceniae]|uniref:Rhomboid family intramembrane serine protease n=1 Tax=Mycolicibacterium sarraceniae TaxID=1534348 RepID=A0A7I7SSU7_9MYCO|nr:rhomboid family intramembrane serine protease [Mycolicibacterium sarraceniae]BBY59888.1 rhomboid family intramembrane serine protease [Mycolicibacterium sarraceniae]